MISDMQNVEALARVISQATAPSFLLGAVAGFASILTTRMEKITDRSRALNTIPDDDAARVPLKADLPRLMRRAQLVNRAIYLAVGSGVATASLLLVALLAPSSMCGMSPASRCSFHWRSPSWLDRSYFCDGGQHRSSPN